MGKVNAKTNVGNVTSLDELKRYCTIALTDIAGAINGNITFSDNLSVRVLDVSFAGPNLVTTIPHGLGRIPLMWIAGNVSADSVIYQGQASTNQYVYLAASAVCDARILLI